MRANNTEGTGLRIDAETGDDLVSINTTSNPGTPHRVTLGEGLDTLELTATGFIYDSGITVIDFATGRGGDKVRLSEYLAVMADGFDGTDPFASGYLRLEQSEGNTLLQFDSNGGGDEWRTIVVFENARAAAFRTINFDDGYDPTYGSPMIPSYGPLAPTADAVAP